MLEFDELRLRVRQIGDGRYLALANGPLCAAEVLTVTDEPAKLRGDFAELIDIDLGRAPARGSDVAGRLRLLGRSVFDLLFSGALGDFLTEGHQRSGGHGRRAAHGLRLRFDMPAQLRDLPIEALTSPADNGQQTLALNYNLSLVRSVAGGAHESRLPAPSDPPDFIHLLVAAASPVGQGLPPIDVEPDLAAVRDALPALTVDTTVLRHATRGTIQSWLDDHADKPAAVLLIAHGDYDQARGEGVVLLESDGGSVDRVPAHLLSGIMVRAQQLRLVVLNLCSGATDVPAEPFSGLAQALVGRGVPAVVGMRGDVTDRAASIFGPKLLEGICENKTVDEAVTAARQHISNLPGHTTIEWATPVLFLHESCGHGWLFKARHVRREGERVVDPLLSGDAERQRLSEPGNVDLATVIKAAQFMRGQRDWAGVEHIVRTRRPAREQATLLAEARLELAWPRLEKLCAVLAEEADPDQAEKILSTVADSVPETVRDLLRDEIIRVRLAVAYRTAREHLDRGEFDDALGGYTEILAVRPGGYERAEQCAAYARGRLAGRDGTWPEAVTAFAACGDFADAPGQLGYALGRLAADADDWKQAQAGFRTAAEAGITPDEWSDYAAARWAEASEDWSSAAELFSRLGEFRDSARRALVMVARLAVADEDWLTAARRLRELAGAGVDVGGVDVGGWLAEVEGKLSERGADAMRAGDWALAVTCLDTLAEVSDEMSPLLSYARGRVAEVDDDWARAREHYRATEHADAAGRLAYATARLAEADGDLSAACELFAGSALGVLDAAQRGRYAAGLLADERGDWTAVIDGFDVLPDDYADGDVGRRRGFARAGLAAERGEWSVVLAQLADARDEDREGQVGLVRRKARVRLAEADGDYATVIAVCTPATDMDPELSRSVAYARGRMSEADDDWAAALAAYAELPEDHADAGGRHRYADARLAEQDVAADDDWLTVAERYALVPTDLADTRVRAAYARLRAAVAEGDWAAALAETDQLPSGGASDGAPTPGGPGVGGPGLDVGAIADYVRGRRAEDDGDWATAITAYGSCVSYEDAAARLAYVRGRELEEAGRLRAAVAAYGEISGEVSDGLARQERLAALLDALPWVDEVITAPVVADPLAQGDPTYPYRALRAAGVTPAASTTVVQDASYTLMERGGMSWQERVAWQQLRVPAQRLRLDALLYPLRDPAAFAERLRVIEPEGRTSLIARLCADLPEDAPLITLLAGDRDAATKAWRARLTEHPSDITTVHCLANTSYWRARELEDIGAWEQAQPVWRYALAWWAVVLSDDDYWASWRQARSTCYGHAITPADTARLRAELGRDLIDLLSGYAERHATAGRPDQGANYQELIYFLQSEMEGARALGEVGGFAVSGERPFACGPEYLTMTGLADQFGTFVADAEARRTDDESIIAVLRRLRWAFSEQARAYSFDEHSRFELALRALPAFYRSGIAELPPDCAGPAADGHGSVEDCPSCVDFLGRNPAYTYLNRRRVRLHNDAVGLAVRAHLSIARGLLATRSGLDRAVAELTETIDIAGNAAMTVRTRQAVLRMILGRTEALLDHAVQRIEWLDEAIALVERMIPVLDSSGRSTLTLKLAEVLVDRGVWYGFSCREAGVEPDITRSMVDLRRSLELNPESGRARDNLARGLMFGVAGQLDARSVERKLAVLTEAYQVLHEGLNRAPGNNRLLDSLRTALGELEPLLFGDLSVAELAALTQATEPDDNDRHRLLYRAMHAVRKTPMDETVRSGLLDALHDELRRRGEKGDADA